MKTLLIFASSITIVTIFCFSFGTTTESHPSFTLIGTNFNDTLPLQSTCEGKGQSPALFWVDAPVETESYAITMHRTLANGYEEVCWVQYNLSKSLKELEINNQEGSFGVNSLDDLSSYAAPCLIGKKNQTYTITIYALSKAPALRPSNTTVTKAELELALLHITLAKTSKDVLLISNTSIVIA